MASVERLMNHNTHAMNVPAIHSRFHGVYRVYFSS